jgi:hypothetical protein
MKAAHHDPIDHSRTTQPHAGESIIDTLWFPGLILIGVGVGALAGLVAATAYGHHEFLRTLGIIAVSAITLGVLLIAVEHRRVNRIEKRWLADHPDGHPHRHDHHHHAT